MTQHEFDSLPGLLTRAQFMGATGLTPRKVREAVENGTIKRLLLPRAAGFGGRARAPGQPGGSYGKYYKRDAARLSGFVLR